MKQLVLATSNPHKVKELAPLLANVGVEVLPQTHFFCEEAVEDGASFIENALIKARFASQRTGLPAIADDSGLEVAALNGRPGVYSARYAGNSASDECNTRKVLAELEGLPFSQRQACYHCAVALVHHPDDAVPLIGTGRWCGEVLTEARTGYGVGYDPIIWMPDYFRSASEIPLEVKNRVSHRAQAVHSVLSQLAAQKQEATR